MGEMTKDDIIDALVKSRTPRAKAVMYADAFIEYREAAANIAKNGTIVQHPRTANPIENPYLVIRDRAMRKIQNFRGIKADFLW